MLIKCLGEDLPENCFTRTSARTTVVAGRVWSGAQPVLHFGGGGQFLTLCSLGTTLLQSGTLLPKLVKAR